MEASVSWLAEPLSACEELLTPWRQAVACIFAVSVAHIHSADRSKAPTAEPLRIRRVVSMTLPQFTHSFIHYPPPIALAFMEKPFVGKVREMENIHMTMMEGDWERKEVPGARYSPVKRHVASGGRDGPETRTDSVRGTGFTWHLLLFPASIGQHKSAIRHHQDPDHSIPVSLSLALLVSFKHFLILSYFL